MRYTDVSSFPIICQVCPHFDNPRRARSLARLIAIIVPESNFSNKKMVHIRFADGGYSTPYLDDIRILEDRIPMWPTQKVGNKVLKLFYPGATWEVNRRIIDPFTPDAVEDKYLRKNILIYPHDFSMFDGTGKRLGFTHSDEDVNTMLLQTQGITLKEYIKKPFDMWLSDYDISKAKGVNATSENMISFSSHREGAKMFHALEQLSKNNKGK